LPEQKVGKEVGEVQATGFSLERLNLSAKLVVTGLLRSDKNPI
jgi:hypothetical protein